MKCKCGRQTNDPSGICAICRLKLNDPDTIQGSGNRGQGTGVREQEAQRHKVKKVKNNVPRETYICIQCQKPYNPTSSAQKRCPDCKIIHIAEYQKKYKPSTDRLRTLDKTKDVIPAQAGIQSGNNGLFAQLLYASELLDRQIKLVSDNGAIDIKIILDIRMRLGAVLKGNE